MKFFAMVLEGGHIKILDVLTEIDDRSSYYYIEVEESDSMQTVSIAGVKLIYEFNPMGIVKDSLTDKVMCELGFRVHKNDGSTALIGYAYKPLKRLVLLTAGKQVLMATVKCVEVKSKC